MNNSLYINFIKIADINAIYKKYIYFYDNLMFIANNNVQQLNKMV